MQLEMGNWQWVVGSNAVGSWSALAVPLGACQAKAWFSEACAGLSLKKICSWKWVVGSNAVGS